MYRTVLIFTMCCWAVSIAAQVSPFSNDILNFHAQYHLLNQVVTCSEAGGDIKKGKVLIEDMDSGALEKDMARYLLVRRLYGRDSVYALIDQEHALKPQNVSRSLYLKVWAARMSGDQDDLDSFREQLNAYNPKEVFLWLVLDDAQSLHSYFNENVWNEDAEKSIEVQEALAQALELDSLKHSDVLLLKLYKIYFENHERAGGLFGMKMDSVVGPIQALYETQEQFMDKEKLSQALSRCETEEGIAFYDKVKAELNAEYQPSPDEQMMKLFSDYRNEKIEQSEFEEKARELIQTQMNDENAYRWKATLYSSSNFPEDELPRIFSGLIKQLDYSNEFKSFIANTYTKEYHLEFLSQLAEDTADVDFSKITSDPQIQEASSDELYMVIGTLQYTEQVLKRMKSSPMMRYMDLSLSTSHIDNWPEFGEFLLHQPMYEDGNGRYFFGYPEITDSIDFMQAYLSVGLAIKKYPGCYNLYKLRQSLFLHYGELLQNDSLLYSLVIENTISALYVNQSAGMEYRGEEDLYFFFGLQGLDGWRPDELFEQMARALPPNQIEGYRTELKRLIEINPDQVNLERLLLIMN